MPLLGGANIGPMIGANMSHILGAASWPERRRATQSFPLQRTNEGTKEGRIAWRRRQPNSQPPTAASQTTSELKFRKSQTTSELVKLKQSQNSKRKVNYYSTKSK